MYRIDNDKRHCFVDAECIDVSGHMPKFRIHHRGLVKEVEGLSKICMHGDFPFFARAGTQTLLPVDESGNLIQERFTKTWALCCFCAAILLFNLHYGLREQEFSQLAI